MKNAFLGIVIFLIMGGFFTGHLTGDNQIVSGNHQPKIKHVIPQPEIAPGQSALWTVMVYETGEDRHHELPPQTKFRDIHFVSNSGSSKSPAEFVVWAKKCFPAQRHALLICRRDNKNETPKGEMFERFKTNANTPAPQSPLAISDITRALAACGGVDLAAFDPCPAGLAETSYAINRHAAVLVGAEGAAAQDEWDIDAILDQLQLNPGMNPLQLGRLIVDEVCRDNKANLSVIDLSQTDGFLSAVRTFSETAVNHWQEKPELIKPAAEDLIAATQAMVAYERHKDTQPGAAGLDIYFPRNAGGYSVPASDSTGFLGASGWSVFLQAFGGEMKDSWLANRRDGAQEFGNPNHTDLSHFCRLITLSQTSYYSTDRITHIFYGGGTAQSFYQDEDFLVARLPFAFPYFGQIIPAESPVFISSNGYIDFNETSNHSDYSNSTSELASNKRIAPCWSDLMTNGTAQQSEDIYITSNSEAMIIRWAAETYGDNEPVNVELVLTPNGRIQFNYGDGNQDISPWDTAPTIGISNGDGNHYRLSYYNGFTALNAVQSEIYVPIAPTVPDIMITAPNGGEVWRSGSTKTITWESEAVAGDVAVDYTVNNGDTWINVVSQIANSGSYDWTVATANSTNCRVRVKETDGSPADTSDEVFTIEPEPAISLTYPNGGQTLQAGYTCYIQWQGAANVENIKLEYTTNGGETWNLITDSTANDGEHQWLVPNTISPACKIRVGSADWDPGTMDSSDNYFSIVANQDPALWITSPNGREFFLYQQSVNITWDSMGSIEAVKLDYTTNNGESWTNIVSITANDGNYTWTVPSTPSDVCRVRVAGLNNEPSDVSDETFTIMSPDTITVTSPNGNEQWQIESSQTITWNSTGDIRDVRIDYSTDNGETWNVITDTTPNDGSYNWMVPSPASEYCYIRILAADRDDNVGDTSDSTFAIVQ